LYRFYKEKFRRESRPKTGKEAFLEMTSRHQRSDEDNDTPFSDSFRINESDDESLQGTWIARYVEDDRNTIAKLKDEVAIAVSQQNSILEDMFDQRADETDTEEES
jgi:hypothetical protein